MSALLMAGGAMVAAGLLFGKGGNQLSIVNNISNVATMSSNVTVNTDCFSAIAADQQITVNSTNPPYAATASLACAMCQDAVAQVLEKRAALETYWGVVPQTSLMPVDKASGNVFANPCAYICEDVSINGVNQSQVMSITSSCSVDSNLAQNLQTNLSQNIQDQLSNQEDIFGQLGSIFAGTKASISNDFSSVMAENLTTTFVNDLHASLKSRQLTTISGTSIFAKTIDQEFTGSVTATLRVTNNVVDQMAQSSDFSLQQTLKNINDTTGQLANDFLNVIDSVAGMLNTLTGQLLFIIGGILLCVIMVIGSLFLVSKQFQSAVGSYLGAKITAKIGEPKQTPVASPPVIAQTAPRQGVVTVKKGLTARAFDAIGDAKAPNMPCTIL